MLCVFLTSVIMALIEFKGFPPSFLSIVKAGEVASWRLKWVALPVVIIVLWGGARIIRSIKTNPTMFIGLRAARLGFVASVLVMLMIGTLIGVTVPERLRQRQAALTASLYSRAYTFDRAVLTYRELHGFIPAPDDLVNELKTLPDPDGSIAEALNNLDVNGYQPSTIVASASSKGKPLAMRGNAIRKASTNSVTATDHGGVSFTNYELRLPGEDKVLNTDDDLIVRDGLVMTIPEYHDFISSRNRVP
jgi:type II secretory pathway pseudopilin PulG